MKIVLKTEVVAQIFDRIRNAAVSVQGTKDYNRYNMQMDCKSDLGKWIFVLGQYLIIMQVKLL